MESVKSLTYLASREVYYHWYKIIKNFTFTSPYYCLCHKCQGYVRELCGRKDYYCVCRTCKQYSIDELNDFKHNSFKLGKCYLNILRDLAEILSIDPAAWFWETENYYWFRYKYTCLRSNLDYLFSSKNMQWNLLYQ